MTHKRKYLGISHEAMNNYDGFFSLEMGKPTTILAEIYVESFGNIEEANMVGNVPEICLIVCLSVLHFGFVTVLLFVTLLCCLLWLSL